MCLNSDTYIDLNCSNDIPERDSAPETTCANLACTASSSELEKRLLESEADAAGEVILSTVGMTKGDPTALDDASLLLLLKALQRIGAEDAAREMALESTGYWKALN